MKQSPGRLRRAWSALAGRDPIPMHLSTSAAPALAGRRRRLEHLSLNYFRGAERSRLTGDWNVTLGSPDQELYLSNRELRARARDLSRNNSYVGRYLELRRNNIIGPTGFKHIPQVR